MLRSEKIGGSLMQYLKAFTGAIVTGLGTLQVAYADNVVSNQEWVGIAIATVVALGAVWAVPNKVKTPVPPSTTVNQ